MVQQMTKSAAVNRSWKTAKLVPATLMLAALVGCSGYDKLPQQNVDDDYQVFLTTVGGGDLTVYLIKAFEVDGKVAMCGGFTSGSSALGKNIDRNFADISQVYLDGIKIGNGDFMVVMPVHFRQGVESAEFWTRIAAEKPATNCVKTNVDWRPEFADAEFQRKGPNSVRGFD